MNILKVRDISISYKIKTQKKLIVKNVGFELMEGEVLGIAGGSGCGKSTLAKSIMGILPQNASYEEGEIYYKDKKIDLKDKKNFSNIHGKEISMVFQDPASVLNPMRKIKNQFYDILGKKEYKTEKIIELLKEVHLEEANIIKEKYPFELSGGMKQRVVIAMAICKGAKILIADEPTSALDASIRKNIINELKNIKKKKNLSIIIISHNLVDLEDLCDRIIIMNNGEIIEEGSKEDILSNPKNEYTKNLIKVMRGNYG